MSDKALFGDGREFDLPSGWSALEESMLETAFAQTRQAFLGDDNSLDDALERLSAYYDPEGPYAGSTFLAVGPHDDTAITAPDLWAVCTLSMTIPPNAGRRLLGPSELSNIVEHKLRRLSTDARLTDVTAAQLDDMWDMYEAIKTMLPPLGKSEQTNQWVLASKLCARKRPDLFPVRDSKVCGYLAKNPRLGGASDQLGWFSRDLQVFAYLVTHADVSRWIAQAREDLQRAHPDWTVDVCDLRLLDAVLWTVATMPT